MNYVLQKENIDPKKLSATVIDEEDDHDMTLRKSPE
jgi:hypothetical protein